MPLEPEGIEAFAGQWFKFLCKKQPAQAGPHALQLLRELESRPQIREMATNPLMLTAVAILYYNNMHLPHGRAELYDDILKWLARSREKPGRRTAKDCLEILQALALGMLASPEGRLEGSTTRLAAEMLAEDKSLDHQWGATGEEA